MNTKCGQFTWPLEVKIWVPLAVNLLVFCKQSHLRLQPCLPAVVSCAAGLTAWLLCMCWRRLNGLGWMIMLTLPASKAQANWQVNMGAIGSLHIKNSVIELTCSSIMCCWLDYVIIVHVVKAARSLNGLGLVIMPGKPAVQAREPAMLIIAHTANE